MEQTTATAQGGQLIYLSRNSKLARLFQESPASVPAPPRRPRVDAGRASSLARSAATACPKLQAITKPGLELTRPLVAALMREQEGMRCRTRGVLLDNEYVRDVCAAGCHQHCPFLQE